MRSRFSAIVAALALVVGTTAKAEVYQMYTFPTPSAASSASTLGLNLNIANVLTVPSGNAAGTISGGFITGGLTGNATVDMNLDATDSGTLYITGSSLSLSPLNVTQSGTILGIFPYNIALTSGAIGVSVTAGPIAVTNGNFSITAATPGALSLNSGNLNYTLNIPALGVNNQIGVIDLTTSPIAVAFSSLGAVVIPGTADDSASIGVDQIDSNGHTLGGPGITGTSTIDDDGSEVTINFSGISVASTIVSGTLNLPVTVTLNGGIRVGVPEVGSVVMAGIVSTLGLGGLVLRRRRSA